MTNKKEKRKVKSKLSNGKRPILFVQWKDHCLRTDSPSWIDIDDRKKRPIICESVGFKTYEDEDVLILAINQDENGKIGDSMHIIKSCITKRRVIK